MLHVSDNASDLHCAVAGGSMVAVVDDSAGAGEQLLHHLRQPTDKALLHHGLSNVRYNSAAVQRIAHVPQEDSLLVRQMTVRQQLKEAAALRLPATTTADAREQLVQQVTDRLQLAHVRDRRVGGLLQDHLSGGEQRRLSVGLGWVSQANVLLAHQPTSGLDSSTAYNVVQGIKQSLRAEQCVLATIQQSSAKLLSLFDHIWIMEGSQVKYMVQAVDQLPVEVRRQHGWLDVEAADLSPHDVAVYKSPPTDAVHPASYDPMSPLDQHDDDSSVLDYGEKQLEEVELGAKKELVEQSPVDLPIATSEAMVRASSLELASKFTINSSEWSSTPPKYDVSFSVRRTVVLLLRLCHVVAHDYTLLYIQCALHCVYSLFVGLVFLNSNRSNDIGQHMMNTSLGIGWLYFTTCFLTVFRCAPILLTQRRFRAEHSNGAYSTLDNCLAQLLVGCVCVFITYVPSTFIAWFMIGLPVQSIGYMVVSQLLVGLYTESAVNLVCHLLHNLSAALLVAEGGLLCLCIFSSVMNPSSVGAWVFLKAISPFHYGIDGLNQHAHQYITYQCPTALWAAAAQTCTYNAYVFQCDSSLSSPQQCVVSGTEFLRARTHLVRNDAWLDIGLLVACIAACQLVNYVLLRSDVVASVPAAIRSWFRQAQSSNDAKSTPADSHLVAMELHTMADSQLRRSSLTWQQVKVHNAADKDQASALLHDVSGSVQSNELLFILGGSGAGKTTLLSVLSNSLANNLTATGKVEQNGRPLQAGDITYVPQLPHRSLPSGLSVRQILFYTRRLSYPQESAAASQSAVAELVDSLALTAMAGKRVSQLTLSDTKKIALAKALCSRSRWIVLDEITTGLSSASALQLLTYVRAVVKQRPDVACIVTVHQPSNQLLELADRLVVLHKGQLAYEGDQAVMADYFTDRWHVNQVPHGDNVAEHYLEAVAKLAADGQSVAADASAPLVHNEFDRPQKSKPRSRVHGLAQEVLTLTRYQLLINLSNPTIYLGRGLQLLCFALFYGSIWHLLDHTLLNVPFVTVSAMMWFNVLIFGTIAITPFYCAQRDMRELDQLNGLYSGSSFTTATLLASVPYNAAAALLSVPGLWYMIGYSSSGADFGLCVLFSTLLQLSMEANVGLLVEVLRTPALATSGSLVVLGVYILMNGCWRQISNMWQGVSWMEYTLPARFSASGILYAIFHNNTYDQVPGDYLLSSWLDLSPVGAVGWNVLIVIGFVVSFRAGQMLLAEVLWKRSHQPLQASA